jgi:hypothetical protein
LDKTTRILDFNGHHHPIALRPKTIVSISVIVAMLLVMAMVDFVWMQQPIEHAAPN